MAKTQSRAFVLWIVTLSMIYITGMMLSVSGYYLPLDLCDFYFEGHKEHAPMFNATSTNSNITFPASILTKDDMTVKTAHVNSTCVFLADPSMGFDLEEECSGQFHLRDQKLFGQFPVFKSHQSHQVLLKFERIMLEDGTMLAPSDGIIHFLESKRCVTFFTAPEIHPLKPGDRSEDLISRLSEMVPNMLNKEHRKKLKKLDQKVTQLHNDFSSIFHDIASFP